MGQGSIPWRGTKRRGRGNTARRLSVARTLPSAFSHDLPVPGWWRGWGRVDACLLERRDVAAMAL